MVVLSRHTWARCPPAPNIHPANHTAPGSVYHHFGFTRNNLEKAYQKARLTLLAPYHKDAGGSLVVACLAAHPRKSLSIPKLNAMLSCEDCGELET